MRLLRPRDLLSLALAVGWVVFLSAHPLGLIWCIGDDHARVETAGEGCRRPAPVPPHDAAGAATDDRHACSDVPIGLLGDGHAKAPSLAPPTLARGLATPRSMAEGDGLPAFALAFVAHGPPAPIPQRC